MTVITNLNLSAVKLLSRNERTTPNFAKNSKYARHHLQEEESRLSVNEKTVGCRISTIRYQRHFLNQTRSILSLCWKICRAFVTPQSVSKRKTAMFLYHGRSMTLNGNLFIRQNNQSCVIKIDPRYTSQCCPVCGHIKKANCNKKIHLFAGKTVVTNQTMTILEP